MKVLVITNLFPNQKEPTRAQYNKQQFDELSKSCELKVVAPIPYLQYSLNEVPKQEIIDGIEVYHPRYLVIPKILRSFYGVFFFFGIRKTIDEIYKRYQFDIILSTWAYPDGFASALIAKIFKKPFFIKVHGTDVNSFTRYFFRRKMIMYAFKKAIKIIAVSADLKRKIVKLGIPQEKIEVIPNGINFELFRPIDKNLCREALDLPIDKKIVLYVGNLEKVKGVDVLIDAMQYLDKDVYLVIAGDGRLKHTLKSKVKNLKLEENIVFVGSKPHQDMPFWINASDIFCLPSRNEGCPNVVLEALSCGTPVVATRVGGVPDIIESDEVGLLVEPASSDKLSAALKLALSKEWDRQSIREKAPQLNWKDNAKELMEKLGEALSCPKRREIGTKRKIIKAIASAIIPKHVLAWRGISHDKKIALTFDDGPNHEFTPKVLDLLKKEGIKATFFLIGKDAEKNIDLATDILRNGHSIGAHSYSHRGYTDLCSAKKRAEIDKSVDILEKISNSKCRLFRPPRGSLSISELLYCFRKGLVTVLWSVDSGDGKLKETKDILANLIGNGTGCGDIILLHDDNNLTLSILPEVIGHFKKKGFEFVTVEEMLR